MDVLGDASPDNALQIQATATGVGFWIHVSPKAKHEFVGGVHGDALRVSVKAPPVEGKANAACVRVLAQALNLSRTDIQLDPAAKGKRKRILLTGDFEELRSRLQALASARQLR